MHDLCGREGCGAVRGVVAADGGTWTWGRQGWSRGEGVEEAVDLGQGSRGSGGREWVVDWQGAREGLGVALGLGGCSGAVGYEAGSG